MAKYDCRTCRGWQQCIGVERDWYHYGEVRWCPFQILWILGHAATFSAGQWPAPRDDSPGSTQVHPEARFVKCGIALAEVRARLKGCPQRGKVLTREIEEGRTYETLSEEAHAILMYAKGFGRKAISFTSWQRQKRYIRRKIEASHFCNLTPLPVCDSLSPCASLRPKP